MVWALILTFLAFKTIVLVTGGNAIISVVDVPNMFTGPDDAMDLFDDEFFFAFGVRNYLKNEYKDDPNYV
jgi:hypothetical protein